MAAPRYVKTSSVPRTPSYSSPDVVPQHWGPNRPADLLSGQPVGGPLGYQGPDQGYALKLTGLFDDRIVLSAADERNGVSRADVHGGCVQVALKRAALFGRAPVVYDLEVAYCGWGWLDESPSADLVELRGKYFGGVADPHHYTQSRHLVATVADQALLLTPAQVAQQYQSDWRLFLDAPADPGTS